MTTSSHPKGPGGRPGSPAGDLPPPDLSRVRRVSLIRREVREYLSPSALEILFAHADVVAEGAQDLDARAPLGATFASVMITIDLRTCKALLREPVDDATAAKVAELLQVAPELRARVVQAASDQLAAIAGVAAAQLAVRSLEVQTRAEGTKILIDTDAVLGGRKGG